MMKSVRRPSAVPVYAVAAVWLLYTLVFGLNSAGQALLCAGLSAAVYLIVKTKFPGETVQVEVPQPKPDTGDKALDELIVQGRASAREIRLLNSRIPDAKVTAALNGIEDATAKILSRLEQDKAQARRCREFLDYYLPTTVKLLRQYVQLQAQGRREGNIDMAMDRIEAALDKVRRAFGRQLDSLFESEVVDVTADIAVMEQMLQASGLAGEDPLGTEKGENDNG